MPELAGFWLLSLLQASLTLYTLANGDALALPLERGVCVPLLVLLVVELVLGIRALQLMVRSQALKFHLSQVDSLGNATRTDGEGENIEMQELN